ncbi:MAG: hypothetical protein ACKO2P_04850 [Planctomycetota bacterium]
MLRSSAALRLRRARAGQPEPSAEPDAAESPPIAPPAIPGRSDSPDTASDVPHGSTGDLANELSLRIARMRDQLLEELQASFAGLREDQAVAWSEQTSLLKSLSANLTAGAPEERVSTARRKVPEPPIPPPASQLSPPASGDPLLDTAAPGASQALSRWEAIRQNFLQTDGKDLLESPERPGSERTERTRLQQPSSGSPAAVSLETAMRNAADLSDIEFADVLPEPIDTQQIPDSELRSVFISRELLFAELIGRYRRRREHHQQLLSAEQLRSLQTQLPEDIEDLVTVSLRRIDELTRLSELELAFERARLSRERKQLEQSRFLLENQARQLGLTVNPDGTLSRSDELGGRPSGRRWLGKLGFGGPTSPAR